MTQKNRGETKEDFLVQKNRGETKEDFLVQDRQQPLKLPFCHPLTKMGAAKYHFAYGIHHD